MSRFLDIPMAGDFTEKRDGQSALMQRPTCIFSPEFCESWPFHRIGTKKLQELEAVFLSRQYVRGTNYREDPSRSVAFL